MKYLWIGVCRDECLEKEILENGGQLFSGHVANDSLCQGLINNGISFDSINGRGIKHYPRYKQLFPKRYTWEDSIGKHVSVGYINGKYSRIISRVVSMKREARRWVRKNKNEEVQVLIYGLSSPSLAILPIIKRKIPNATVSLIIPDLPEFKDLNASALKKLLKGFEAHYINKTIKYVDHYFLFAEKMAEYLNIPDGCWTVMEGSINLNSVKELPPENERKKAVMYAGICNYDFGMDILLKAFEMVPDEDAELWIAGTGNAEQLIRECAEKDSRIKYYGYISHDEVLKMELQASAVINLRNPAQLVSKYAFPSKIFEYMLSACPVLSFRVDGIPDEYYDYIIEMENTSPECVAASMTSALRMSSDDRETVGKRAREFVLTNKNNTVQVKKILDFISEKGV